jgi:hypothetical protein
MIIMTVLESPRARAAGGQLHGRHEPGMVPGDLDQAVPVTCRARDDAGRLDERSGVRAATPAAANAAANAAAGGAGGRADGDVVERLVVQRAAGDPVDDGLTKPSGCPASWSARAIRPTQNGVAALVPPTPSTSGSSAGRLTSLTGVDEPWPITP